MRISDWSSDVCSSDLTGIDSAPSMIATARRRAREAGVENAAFVEMEAECLTFPDDSFDAIISRYGYPHFTDAVQALRESYRVLRAGGRFAAAMHGAVAANPYFTAPVRSEERRVGQECVSKCRSWW